MWWLLINNSDKNLPSRPLTTEAISPNWHEMGLKNRVKNKVRIWIFIVVIQIIGMRQKWIFDFLYPCWWVTFEITTLSIYRYSISRCCFEFGLIKCWLRTKSGWFSSVLTTWFKIKPAFRLMLIVKTMVDGQYAYSMLNTD